jgi:hypothetical protein
VNTRAIRLGHALAVDDDEDGPHLNLDDDAEPGPTPQGHRRRCPECRGQKRLPGLIKVTGMGSGMGSTYGPCPTCDGFGYVTDGAEE